MYCMHNKPNEFFLRLLTNIDPHDMNNDMKFIHEHA